MALHVIYCAFLYRACMQRSCPCGQHFHFVKSFSNDSYDCIGALLQARNKEYIPLQVIELDGRHEIVSLVGTLSEGGHLHASLSDVKGGVVGGHVMGDMVVFTTAEIVIGECCQLEFTREMDDKTGFKELSVHPKLKNI